MGRDMGSGVEPTIDLGSWMEIFELNIYLRYLSIIFISDAYIKLKMYRNQP